MKTIIILLLFAFVFPCFFQAYAFNERSWDDVIPQPDFAVPDTNFTFMSYGFPTISYFQLIKNNHLYVVFGMYIIIYEIQTDATLIETGNIMLSKRLASICHDGDYLYVAGQAGIEIFEGTNYYNPQRVGLNEMGLNQIVNGLAIYGDSLYFSSDYSGYQQYVNQGIMNVADRSNPFIVFEDTLFHGVENFSPPVKRGDYMYWIRQLDSYPYKDIGVIALNDTSGVPVFTDSVFYSPIGYYQKMILENDVLYVLNWDFLSFYEFEDGYIPILRNRFEYPDRFQDMTITYENNEVFAYITVAFTDINSLLKVNVTDIYNPIIVDSISVLDTTYQPLFYIECKEGYSYCIKLRDSQFSINNGIHVIDWNMPPGSEIIQSEVKHQPNEGIAIKNNVVYAWTNEAEIIVLDITDVLNPIVVEPQIEELYGWDTKVAGNKLYTQSEYRNLNVYDLIDPFYPQYIGTYTIPDSLNAILRYAGYDDYLIFTYRVTFSGPFGLKIVDLSDFSNPIEIYDEIVNYELINFRLFYPYLYLFHVNPGGQVHFLNISDINNPIYQQGIVSGLPVIDVTKYNDYLYVSGGSDRKIYDISGNYPLHLATLHDLFCPNMEVDNNFMFIFGKETLESWGFGVHVWDIENDPLLSNRIGYFNGGYWYEYDLEIRYPYVIYQGHKDGVTIGRFDDPTSYVFEETGLPLYNKVLNAYPNPFNSDVSLIINGENDKNGTLSIYDIQGRLVKSIDLESNDRDQHSVIWDGRDNTGASVSSGLYFATYKSDTQAESIKLVLLK